MPMVRLTRNLPVCFVLTAVIFCVRPPELSAQSAARRGLAVEDLAQPWRWRKYDRDGRLPSGPVSVLGHDRNDVVYAGTDEGLFGYNGYQWSRLASIEPLGANPLTRIVESGGEVYVATARDVWILRLGIELHRIYESGRFFIAESPVGGVFVVDLARGRHVRLENDGPTPVDGDSRPIPFPRGDLLDYAVDDERVHWLATSEGLHRRQIGKRGAWQIDSQLGPDLSGLPCRRLFLVKHQLIRRSPVSFVVDVSRPRFQLWARLEGTTGSILARREASGKWSVVSLAEPSPEVSHLVRDGRGNYYAATGSGALFFSRDGDTWRHATELGIGPAKVGAGLLDLHGYVWFALEYSERRGGVARFDPESRRWEQLREETGPIEGGRLAQRSVRSLLETADGSIWIGTATGLHRYRDGAVAAHRSAGRTEFTRITGLAEDQRGRVWVSSTSFQGAFYHDGGRWFEYLETDEKSGRRTGLSRVFVRRIVRDTAGRLWFLPVSESSDIGLTAATLYRFQLSLGRSQLDSVTLPPGVVNDLLQSQNGDYWAATDRGLLRLGLETDRLVTKRLYGPRDGLLSSRIWAVAENRADGSIWVCYRDSGVSRVHGDSIENYDESNGLRSPVVWSIMSTVSVTGWNVWLGTDRGVSRFDGECWYHYSVAGLKPQMSQVLSLLPSRSEEDSILVGTSGNGVFRFRRDDHRRPKLTMTDFARQDRGRDALVFSWDARDMKDGTPPGALQFRHRLDSGSWSLFSTEKSVEYSRLEPDLHTFEVQVRDLDGNSNRPLFHRFRVTTGHARGAWYPALFVGGGILLVAVVLATVIVARRVANPALVYRGVFRGLDEAVLVIDDRGRIVDYNGVCPELLGLDSTHLSRLARMPALLVPILHGEEVRRVVSQALAGKSGQCTHELSSGDASRSVLLRAVPLVHRGRGSAGRVQSGQRDGKRIIGAVLFVVDRTGTERARGSAERRLRMNVLRGLAENVSSRLTESLVEVRRGLEMLASPTRSDQESGLEAVKGRTDRVEELTRALAVFAGTETLGKRDEVSAADLMEGLLEPSDNDVIRFSGEIDVDVRGQPGLWNLAVDVDAVRNALGEVLRNAVDAMPRGGKVRIRMANVYLEGPPETLPTGRFVEITVCDTGSGMDRTQRELAFDPLYSTKPPQCHGGTGLSIAYGVVRSHGGEIRVEGGSEGGTKVSMFLPAV